MKILTTFSKTLLIFFIAMGCAYADLEPTVTGTINTKEIHVGDTFTITITVHNTTSADIDFPEVPAFESVSHEDSVNLTGINGTFQSEVSHSMVFQAKEAGVVTVPATTITTTDGRTLQFHEFKLRVLPEGQNQQGMVPVLPPNSGISPNPPPQNPGMANQDPTASAQGDQDSSGRPVPTDASGEPLKLFCRITPETTDAYVGQAIPMLIQFYIREDVRTAQDSIPDIQGSDFMMQSLLNSRSTMAVVASGDYAYLEERWFTSIIPLKAGDLPLVLTRETNWSPPQSMPSFSAFFSNPFRRPPTNRDSVSSETMTVHVKALPEQGRPPDFDGAVGDFQVTGTATPNQVIIGEPVQVQFNISGEGNFDRVTCPIIPTTDQWKAYPPKISVVYKDSSQSVGDKTYTLSMVPKKEGTLPIPQAHFSFFNPKAAQYVTVPTTLPDIIVLPSSAPIAQVTGATAAIPLTDTDDGAPPAPPTEKFSPNVSELGHPASTILPIYKSLPFQITFFTTLAVFLLSTGLKTYLDQTTQAEQQRMSKSLRIATTSIRKHLALLATLKNDDPLFLDTSRSIIGLVMAHRWNLPAPEAITRLEIESREPVLATTLSPILDKLDELHYSGRTAERLTPVQIEAWTQLMQQLAKYADPKIKIDARSFTK